MQLILVIAAIASGILLVPAIVLFGQVLAALTKRSQSSAITSAEVGPVVPSTIVLMPAHNEAEVLQATLNSLAPSLSADIRLLLVADNCSDATTSIAGQHKIAQDYIEVIERRDLDHIGKGFALDFGVRHLADDPPEVVIILDADCVTEPASLVRLSQRAMEVQRPTQAVYLMTHDTRNLALPASEAGQSPDELKNGIGEFAWCMQNLIRPLGNSALGLPCQLMGSGMAFPWDIIINADLATGSIVEDMKLGLDLAAAGTAPMFDPRARVDAFFPTEATSQQSQQVRWIHGHLDTIKQHALPIVFKGLIRWDRNLVAMGLDILVPPLSILVGLALLLAFVGLGVGWGSSSLAIAVLAALPLVLLSGALIVGWWFWGRDILPAAQLGGGPKYLLSRFSILQRFFTDKQSAWVKTGRK